MVFFAQNIDENRSRELSPASCSSPANANEKDDEADTEVRLKTTLAEMKNFRQDNQNYREVEERISNTEERVQSVEEVMEELLKLQTHLEAKQTKRDDPK